MVMCDMFSTPADRIRNRIDQRIRDCVGEYAVDSLHAARADYGLRRTDRDHDLLPRVSSLLGRGHYAWI